MVWDDLLLEIAGSEIAGQKSASLIRSAVVGGDLREGTYAFSAVCGEVPPPKKGYAVLSDLFPTSRSFTIVRNKWSFPKAKDDPAAVKITYSAKTGVFKGSFKVVQSNEGFTPGRVRTKKTSVKVKGFVIDGVGLGVATSKNPLLAFEVTAQ